MTILKVVSNHKRPQTPKQSWERGWKCHTSWFQAILQSYSNQNLIVRAQNRHIALWDRMESSETSPCLHDQLIYNKGAKNIQWGKADLLSKWCWEYWTATCKRMKLDYFLTTYTKLSSKWVEDWDVIPQTIKLIEENTGGILFAISLSNIFWTCLLRQGQQKQK